MDSKVGKIVVNYCGGWGYFTKARVIKEAVEYKFPDMFEVELLKDAGVTGRLEVTVFIGDDDEEGVLIHSKENGDGFVSNRNLDEFIGKISDLL